MAKIKLSNNVDEYKAQLEKLFNPWRLKNWRVSKHKASFTLVISDSIVTKAEAPLREIDTWLFLEQSQAEEVEITNEDLKKLAASSKPVMLLYILENKFLHLEFNEHYLGILFSENPSRTAKSIIPLALKEFKPLTKSRLKGIREFAFKWKKPETAILESGTYFTIKDGLKELVTKAISDVGSLGIEVNLDPLRKIEDEINRAIYTVAIVGPTKAGKSTIINSLVSKNVSPIDIRPTTGIPMSIVPGAKECSEILLKDGQIIPGDADATFLNEYVAIDRNRGNHKGVKMVTVWVKSEQMEKGLSFCDFPGLDDADPVIEKTVENALQFVNAIVYVIDASGNEKGYKFPKQYRDDLLSLKHKDRIFLVVNKIDDFTDQQLFAGYKNFIDEQLELLDLKRFLPFAPIYMVAKTSFENRKSGIYDNDEMSLLEKQIWDYLLANNKSGLHNLLNIIGQISLEYERTARTLQTRLLSGDKQREISGSLASTQSELEQIKSFEDLERQKMIRWLFETLQTEKGFLIANYRNYLLNVGLNSALPNNQNVRAYLIDQFSVIAPEIFELLEDKIADLNNELNVWVGEKLQSVEVKIDKYSKQQFKNSENFNQLLRPIINIFSESYGKTVPTNLIGNILYHIVNAVEAFGDVIWEIFTDKQAVRNRKINGIVTKLEKCYDEVFDQMYFIFHNHLNHKCDELLEKVVDRTNIYVSGLRKQISELKKPLTDSEKNIYTLACDNLASLDNQCEAIKLQIEDYRVQLKPAVPEDIRKLDRKIEDIELSLRRTINSTLIKELGTMEAKKLIPSHLQPKISDRISKILRDHPQTTEQKYSTLESQLQFFDLSEYFEIITNKIHWPFFHPHFNNKESLNKHFVQLGNFRNSIRHSRELTPLIVAEGEASILWFNMALGLKN